jgi:hypothetical protein
MKESNDKKWTIAEVLTNFGQRQSQVQQEKMMKQQLKDALMQNQAQGLSQFVPGMQQEMQPMQQDMSLDQAYQEAKRGGIHLDPSKKGTFKAQATRMGMSIQQAAAHILSNKEEYSPGMVKKANFARNFAKEEGGEMMQSDCPEDFEWNDEMQSCVPVVTDTYAKDRLTDWYSRRGDLVNDPNFGTLEESGAYGNWLNKVLPMINQRMESSNVPIEYTEMIQDNPDALGAYVAATKKSGPKIELAERLKENPFEHAATQLHEYTSDSTAGEAEKYVEPVHQKIANENIKSYEDFLETSPMADAVKNDKDLEEELYNDYMYSSGQTPEGKGNMHSYVMNWRNTFNMDPTKVYTEDDVESMISQAEKSGMLTKGSANYSDDLYKLYRLSKDTKGLTNMFNLMANRSTPQRPDRLNDDIQYAKYGGNFGYMPNFF